jgi:hypothetical protein
MEITYDPVISFLGIYLRNSKSTYNTDSVTLLFTVLKSTKGKFMDLAYVPINT